MNRSDSKTTHRCTFVFAIMLLIALNGCACDTSNVTNEQTDVAPIAETSDLQRIQKSGELRIVCQTVRDDSPLPREGNTLDFELDLANRYAQAMGLEPVFIYIDSHDRLIPELLAGKGDLVVGNLAATRERKKEVAFTVPVGMVREQLVSRTGDPGLHTIADLAGRRVAVHPTSPHRETLEVLRRQHPGIEIHEVSDELDTEEILHRVGLGTLDVAVADSDLISTVLGYRQDIRAAFDITGEQPLAWAVRRNSDELLESLNEFLTDYKLTENVPAADKGDLPAIRQRRTLRVLTRNSAASYFLWKGQLMGFEYDLAKRFAKRHRLRLEMIVPPPEVDLLDWLQKGYGDIVAAALTPTDSRRATGNAFSRAYNHVSQVVVTRMKDEAKLENLDDLDGRTFHVRRGSSYWDKLVAKQTALGGEEKSFATSSRLPPEMATEEIIGKVASDEYDLTLADSHILDIELTWRDDIRSAHSRSNDHTVELCWAVRNTNPELLALINDFIRHEYQGLFYNVKYDQYFRNAARIRSRAVHRAEQLGDLSPYDELVKQYSTQYGFDWRMVVAQMYQESLFKPEAHSFAGAIGLMQVLPRTAEELGITEDLRDPETGIRAGIEYLAWVRERFDPELSVRDRMWFTLAAYNAGTGHVRDARRLAKQMGLNPNRWAGNVEEAMLRLSSPEYYRSAPHGYCRCGQAVHYVREIRQRYNVYVENTARFVSANNL